MQISLSKTVNVDVPQIEHCPNEQILNEFQKLADSYRARRDKWRTVGYEKAMQSIKSYKKEITNANVRLILFMIIERKIINLVEVKYCFF